MKRRYHFHVWYKFTRDDGEKHTGRTYMTGSTKFFSPRDISEVEGMIEESFGVQGVLITDYKLVAP